MLACFFSWLNPVCGQVVIPDIALIQAKHQWQLVLANQAYCQRLDAENYMPLFAEKLKDWETAIKRQYLISQSMPNFIVKNKSAPFANISELSAIRFNPSDAEVAQTDIPLGWQEQTSAQQFLTRIEERFESSSLEQKHCACEAALQKNGLPDLLARPAT